MDTSENLLMAMALAIGVLTVTVIIGIFKPTQAVVALVRLAFFLALVVCVVSIIWGASTMLFLYMSGTTIGVSK